MISHLVFNLLGSVQLNVLQTNVSVKYMFFIHVKAVICVTVLHFWETSFHDNKKTKTKHSNETISI